MQSISKPQVRIRVYTFWQDLTNNFFRGKTTQVIIWIASPTCKTQITPMKDDASDQVYYASNNPVSAVAAGPNRSFEKNAAVLRREEWGPLRRRKESGRKLLTFFFGWNKFGQKVN